MPFTHTFLILFFLLHGSLIHAATLRIATASNFSDTLKQLAPLFKQTSGHDLRISAASSGKIYAQIRHGAPYDLFFSADAARPIALEEEGLSVMGSRLTYAVGQLALWSPGANNPNAVRTTLVSGKFRRLALANPKTAPYGVAALETLKRLNISPLLSDSAARGENIGQTFQFVATGNADIGFVALSQLRQGQIDPRQFWIIPHQFYQPIQQQAVILNHSSNKPVAELFLRFIQSPAAREILLISGYQVEDSPK